MIAIIGLLANLLKQKASGGGALGALAGEAGGATGSADPGEMAGGMSRPPEVSRPGFMQKMGAGAREGFAETWEAKKAQYGIGTGEGGKTTLGSLAGATMQRQMGRINPHAGQFGSSMISSTMGLPGQRNSAAGAPVGRSPVTPMPQRGALSEMGGGGGFYDAGHFQAGGSFNVPYYLEPDETGEVPIGMHVSPGEQVTVTPSQDANGNLIASANNPPGQGPRYHSYRGLPPTGLQDIESREIEQAAASQAPSGPPVGGGANGMGTFLSEEERTFDEKPSVLRAAMAGLFKGNPLTSWARQKGEIAARNRGELLSLAYEKTKGRRMTPNEREDLELALEAADPAGYRKQIPGVVTPPPNYFIEDGKQMVKHWSIDPETGQPVQGEAVPRWQDTDATKKEARNKRQATQIRGKWSRMSEKERIEIFKEAWPGGAPAIDPNDPFSVTAAMMQTMIGSPYSIGSSVSWVKSLVSSMDYASEEEQLKFQDEFRRISRLSQGKTEFEPMPAVDAPPLPELPATAREETPGDPLFGMNPKSSKYAQFFEREYGGR